MTVKKRHSIRREQGGRRNERKRGRDDKDGRRQTERRGHDSIEGGGLSIHYRYGMGDSSEGEPASDPVDE